MTGTQELHEAASANLQLQTALFSVQLGEPAMKEERCQIVAVSKKSLVNH